MASRPVLLSSEGLFPQNRRPDRELINLAMGILTQAVRDLISPQKKVEKDWKSWQEDSASWFNSDKNHAGSFLWVCDVIGADPRKLRLWVQELQHLDRKQKKATILSLIRLTYLRNGPSAPPSDDSAMEERESD